MKKHCLRIFFFILFSPLVLFGQNEDEMPKVDPTGAYQLFVMLRNEIPSSEKSEKLYDVLDRYLEVSYKYGANGDARGIDCSSLVLNSFKNSLQKKLPRTTKEQYKLGNTVDNKNDIAFGDLVFFKMAHKQIDHVGIYIASGHFVHASSSLGVTVNRLNEPYYAKRFVNAKRIEYFTP